MSSPAVTAPASPAHSTMASTRNSPRPSGRTHLAPGQTASRRGVTGSLTQTITPDDTASSRSVSPDPIVLRLRGAHDASGSNTSTRRRIQWAEDVIDNEGLGRKSSKVCCIYHKTRAFGESSSEEDSSSDSSSDDSNAGGSDSPDDGGARMSGKRRGRQNGRGHEHKHDDDCAHGHSHGKGKGKRKPSPNAYEKMPKYNTKQELTKS